MALTQNVEFSGIQVAGAYVKVESITATATTLTAMVVWRASPDSAPLRNKLFSLPYELDGENPIKQAYVGLKALAEFDGAEDA